jgi:hypothetical protein
MIITAIVSIFNLNIVPNIWLTFKVQYKPTFLTYIWTSRPDDMLDIFHDPSGKLPARPKILAIQTENSPIGEISA